MRWLIRWLIRKDIEAITSFHYMALERADTAKNIEESQFWAGKMAAYEKTIKFLLR